MQTLDREKKRFVRAAQQQRERDVAKQKKKESAGQTIVRFTEDHLWVKCDGERAVIGLSEYGQDSVGEVLAIELPEVGDRIEQGETFGEIESSRTLQELIAPITGNVVAVNGELEDNPGLVNEDPHREGWFVEVALADERELDRLMATEAYEEFVAAEQDE